MHPRQEGLVGCGKITRCQPENLINLVRPVQFIRDDVPVPIAEMSDALGLAQASFAFAQRLLGAFEFGQFPGPFGDARFQGGIGGLHALDHVVEGFGHMGDFMAATHRHPGGIIAAFDFRCSRHQFLEGDRQTAGDQQAQPQGAQQRDDAGEQNFLLKLMLLRPGFRQRIQTDLIGRWKRGAQV